MCTGAVCGAVKRKRSPLASSWHECFLFWKHSRQRFNSRNRQFRIQPNIAQHSLPFWDTKRRPPKCILCPACFLSSYYHCHHFVLDKKTHCCPGEANRHCRAFSSSWVVYPFERGSPTRFRSSESERVTQASAPELHKRLAFCQSGTSACSASHSRLNSLDNLDHRFCRLERGRGLPVPPTPPPPY